MDEAETLCRRVAIIHRGRLMVVGTRDALKGSIGADQPTMDVFAYYLEGAVERGGAYRETARTRQTARRLG